MGLKIWLPLNGNLNNIGCSNIIPINHGAIVDTAGKIGQCYSFNGSDQYIDIGYGNGILAKNLSVALWIKPLASLNSKIVFGSTVGTNQRFYLGVRGGTWELSYGSVQWNTDSTATVDLNIWQHLVMTVDNNGIVKLYKNGTYTNETITSNSNNNFNLASNISIGGRADGYYSNCAINDFRLYDHCLSAAEVHEISQALILHYKLDRFSGRPNVNPNLLSGNVNETSAWVADGVTLTKDTDTDSLKVEDKGTSYRRIYNNTTNVWLTSGENFTVSFKAKGATSGIKLKVSRSVADMGNSDVSLQTTWNSYFRTITNTGSGITGGTLSIQTTTDDAVFWIKDIKLEKGTAQTAFIQPGEIPCWIGDSSGYNNNGIIFGTPTFTSSTARYSTALQFNGTNDAINAGKNWQVQGALKMSFGCWVYDANWNNSNTKYYFSSQQTGGFLIAQRANNQIRARIDAYTDAAQTARAYLDADFTITVASGWHHFMGVYNNSSLKLYIDGELKKTTTTTTYGAHFNNSTSLFLGAECAGINTAESYCACRLSDLRVYMTALSDADVKALYELGAKIDNKQNLHIYELDENRSLTSDSTQTLTYTSSSGSYTITTYSTASNNTNQYITASVTCNSYNYTSETYPVQLGKKYYLAIESGNTITTYTGSFTPYRWERQGSGYRRVAGSTTYIRFGQILIEIDFYNADDQLIGTDSFLNSRTYNTGSSSYTSQTITGSAKNKTINIPYLPITNTQNTAYIKIREHYRGKSPYSVTKHTTIREYTSSYGIKLFKRGILNAVFLKEDSNTKIIKPYMVETNNLIEF